MADFRIALGGTISACTTDEMHSALGDLKRELNGSNQKVRPIMRPLTKSSDASVTIPSSTSSAPLVLKIGRPSSGRVWVVTRVVVLGEDDSTTHTNMVASLYVGDEMTASLGQCVRHGVSIPWTTTENERAYVVHDREDLFVKFTATGSTTVPSVTVNVMAWEYPDTAIDAQVI